MPEHEGHMPDATESFLDLWARIVAWLDKYVKHAATPAADRPVTANEGAIGSGLEK